MAIIFGSAHRSDGSAIDGTSTVSTSWNGNKAYPHKGQYQLDLGGNPRQRISVYLDGKLVREVFVDGDTKVPI